MDKIICTLPTPRIEALAKELGKSVAYTNNLVSTWQSLGHQGVEPTIEQLRQFIKERPMLSPSEVMSIDSSNPRARLTRDFTAQELHYRTSNIARRFSDIVDEMVEERIEELTEGIASIKGEERASKEKQLRDMQDPIIGRRAAIDQLTFNAIYDRIKSEFQEYADTSVEEFDEEFGEGNGAIIKDKYQKIIDNFDTLFEDACVLIEGAENIRVVVDKVDRSDGKKTEKATDAVTKKSSRDEDIEEEEFRDDEDGSRATGNDGWSFKVRFVDPHSSLSGDVKRALHDIKKVSPDGSIDTDDLGNVIYINEAHAHAVLIDKLSSMIDADDFSAFDENGRLTFPALERIAKTQPWVQQVINKLEADPQLASLFFADFRKDFIPYWMQKQDKDENGNVFTKTFALNKPTALDSTMSSVIRNYDQGTLVDEDSIYDNLGKIKAVNTLKGLEIIDGVLSELQELEEDDIDLVAESINKALRMVGFNRTTANVKAVLDTEEGITDIENIARALKSIFESAKTIGDDIHLVNTLSEPYRRIAGIIGEVTELDSIQSFRNGDKTYYSYSAPNYVDTMFKILSNASRRQGYIDSQFKSYEWFFNHRTGKWRNEWLRLIESDEDVQDRLELKELNNIDGDEYSSWTPLQIKKAFISEYFSILENKGSKKQFAWYNFPIFSDSPVAKFVKFLKYTGDFKGQLRPLFNQLIRQELLRIRLVEDRRNAGASRIQNFDKGGTKFHFFPELNSMTVDGIPFLDKIRELSSAKDSETIESVINSAIDTIMDANFQNFLTEFSPKDVTGLTDILIRDGVVSTESAAMEKLEEYFWNQSFATSQIIQLTTTDLAFYKNGTDFQKRYKEVYAAGTKLNTNSKYGRKNERTIYLADSIITSANYTDIKKNLFDAVREHRITALDATNILRKFRDINVADAQAYRSISSFRSVLDMMGLWNEKMERAVDRFQHGEWDIEDFDLVWQTIKPFVFTQIDKPDGLGGRMKVPHQNKNSEFLLLSTFSMIANRIGKSPKLIAMTKFMEDNNIDVMQFESAVKAGGQGIIDISVSQDKVAEAISEGVVTVKGQNYQIGNAKSFSDIKEHFDRLLHEGRISQETYNDIMESFEPTEQEVYSMLEKASKNTDGSYNEEVVHTIPYSDYVIQQPTPEHLFDAEAVFGSQFRNLLIADMPEDMEITVNGQTIKGRDNIQNLYQSLIVENLLEDYSELSGKFESIDTLQKAMIDTIKGNPKYGRDMLDALRIVEYTVNGEKVRGFNIPLHNPSTTTKIQELINSMFKNAITKQHIKGGNCILVSNFGYTDKLHILRNEDGSISGAECYMPFYTKDFFRPFLRDVTDKQGNITGQEVDINAIRRQDPELLKMIGYRIPTEDKYSMLPLIIKGFLPQQNGSAIMLPADVTQIAGSDFDVDKLFLMIPEFRVYPYDRSRALRDYKAITNDDATKNLIDSIFSSFGVSEETLDTTELEKSDFKKWFEEHKEEYLYDIPKIRKVKYNNDNPVNGNNRAQRNNMIIDIAYAILTHKSTAEKINDPGTFDKAKLAARIATITNDIDILRAYMEDKGLTDLRSTVASLLKEDLDNLDNILKKHKRERNPLSVNTFIYNHRQNMTGGALIGMYANNTTMQAKFQRSNLAIKANNIFTINNRVIQSLHESYISIGNERERVSKNCANFSAASVDNVKDPVLADLLQNTKTAKIAGFMLRAGMTIQEIGLMFTQPLVRKTIEETGAVDDLGYAIMDARKQLADLGGSGVISKKDVLATNFTSEQLLSNIIYYNMANISGELANEVEGVDIRDVLASNIKAAMLFQHIAEMSGYLSALTSISRADSPNGAIERSIALMKLQTHKVDSYIRESRDKDFPFVGIEGIMRNDFITPEMTIDEMREKLNSASMPMLQAFYSLGIDFGQKLDARYFAQLNPYINSVVGTLFNNAPSGTVNSKMLERFYSQLVTFALSKSELFGNDENNTFDEKRDYYLYDFPKEFDKLVRDPANKDIANLGVIRKLQVKDGKIIMNRSGRLSSTMRDMLMRDFDSLLYMNETARKLALDLFMYSYYQDGFNFGPNSFGNFFSSNFITSFPSVINALRSMTFNIGSEPYFNRFLGQFYANNFDYWYGSETSKPQREFQILPERLGTLLDSGQVTIERKEVKAAHMGGKLFPYITREGVLYRLDTDTANNEIVTYNPLKTHVHDKRSVKYNANMLASEMAEVVTDREREEASKKANTTETSKESESSEELDFTGMEDFNAEEVYSFLDGLSSMNEKPCNI